MLIIVDDVAMAGDESSRQARKDELSFYRNEPQSEFVGECVSLGCEQIRTCKTLNRSPDPDN